MARSLRDLRRKMKAIKSTRQVTKAMELVAASKMRRAVQNAEALRLYAFTSWHILQKIATIAPGAHPFLQEKPVSNVLAILFTSDRGYCGSLNSQMFAMTQRYIHSLSEVKTFQTLDFIAVGKKGQQFLLRGKQSMTAAFPALSNHATFKDVLPIIRLATDGYLEGKYDHVVLLYPDFISALVQAPTAKVLLPFSETELREMIQALGGRKRREQEDPVKDEAEEFKFEPSREEVLKTIVPQLTEIQVYQGVLEAAASEHSARMLAMRNATDNATDILDDLTLVYNQTRQASITAELSELSAATAALEG